MSPTESIWVFPKWFSLNSMNCDNVQKWYGYQGCSMSSNRYILIWSVAHGKRYLPGGSKNVLSISIAGNVSATRLVIPLVTIPYSDFVMIHWIHWSCLGKKPQWVAAGKTVKSGLNFFLNVNFFLLIQFNKLSPIGLRESIRFFSFGIQ